MSTETASRTSFQVPIINIPRKQKQLLLYGARQPYKLEADRDVPEVYPGELLIRVKAIGLNPIDWKSAAYGFGLPSLPCINGREFVGKIMERSDSERSDLGIGDTILSVATDYRDFRKSAFQEYAVASEFNAIKIPPTINAAHASSVGVAFVAAALGLGICLGLVFPMPVAIESLDLVGLAQSQAQEVFPEDTIQEVFGGIDSWNRPHAGEWILIYGASSVTAQMAIQLARKAGLRVAAVADLTKHGVLLEALGAERLFERADLDKTSNAIWSEIKAPIRFALDAVGPETALWCQNLMSSRTGLRCNPGSSSNGFKNSIQNVETPLSHLVCLTGAPNHKHPNVRLHQVPIKLFHQNKTIGSRLSRWLQTLLATGELRLPETVFELGGLDMVPQSLDRIRDGEFSGKRLVVNCEATS